jgi:hypothetical protein
VGLFLHGIDDGVKVRHSLSHLANEELSGCVILGELDSALSCSAMILQGTHASKIINNQAVTVSPISHLPIRSHSEPGVWRSDAGAKQKSCHSIRFPIDSMKSAFHRRRTSVKSGESVPTATSPIYRDSTIYGLLAIRHQLLVNSGVSAGANENSEVPPFRQLARPRQATRHFSKPAGRP